MKRETYCFAPQPKDFVLANIWSNHEQSDGKVRNIFALKNPQRTKPKSTVISTQAKAKKPNIAVPTKEELALKDANKRLSEFNYVGMVVRNNTTQVFLTKGGESFLTKRGGVVAEKYRVETVSEGIVTLVDIGTGMSRALEIME